MIWSFSSDRAFRVCQRHWFYKNILASATAKNPAIRREAYLLSKLNSLAAWRGKIVDQVISTKVVWELSHSQRFHLGATLREAKRLFDLQLDFARNHRLREEGMTVTKAGDAFAAFTLVEYGEGITEEAIGEAWAEIESALVNLASMGDVLEAVKSFPYLIAQRPINSIIGETSVRSVPDLIGFSRSAPPIIVDWKVHRFGIADYRLQLALYAMGLTKCKPHKDFPNWQSSHTASDIKLLEVQLLTKQVREHRVSETDLEDLEDYVATSDLTMRLSCGGMTWKDLRPEHFSTTRSAETCRICVYRKLCWEEPLGNS